MRRITAGICLVAGVVSSGISPALGQDAAQAESALVVDQSTLPDAIDLKGARPKADSSVLPPAVDALPASLEPLVAPPSLALPDAPSQVRVRELRPLTLEEAIQLAEFNSPQLKAAASQVDQAKSALRAAISAWYPTVDLSASAEYFKSYSYRNPEAQGSSRRRGSGRDVLREVKNPGQIAALFILKTKIGREGIAITRQLSRGFQNLQLCVDARVEARPRIAITDQ